MTTSDTPTSEPILTDPSVLRRHGFSLNPSDAPTILEDLIGREVSAVFSGKDPLGYDLLVFEFKDGLTFRVLEYGQCGAFSFQWAEPQTPFTL
jgi:hypothetical protein